MAMKRCPICGENYSDTYKSCPFCEEEAALQRGNQLRRGGRGGKRASSGNKRGQPNLLSPILVILILIMAALLVYLLFGDKIADQLAGNQTEDPGTEEVTPAPPTLDEDEDEDTTAPEVGTDTDDQDDGEGTADTAEETDLTALPETLTMSYLGSPKTEFTMSVGDDPIPLTASGGSGSYTWSSSDESIATVDADGKVSAVSAGQATITVTDGSGKGTCMVRVKGGTSSGQTTTTPSSSAPKLSSTDFTTHVGDPDVQLKVSGTTSPVTWASKNTGIATVSGSGVVKAVSAGTTTITATVDGKVLECIVRVTK